MAAATSGTRGWPLSPLWFTLALGCILLSALPEARRRRGSTGSGQPRAAAAPAAGGSGSGSGQTCAPAAAPDDAAQPGQITVLVTGAAGLLGRHVAAACLAKGWRVVAVDAAEEGHGWGGLPRGSLAVPGDLADPRFVDRLFATYGFKYVYHMAPHAGAGAGAGASWSPYVRSHTYRRNLVGSAEVLNAFIRHGADCFVFGSSATVYGHRAGVPDDAFDEDAQPQPRDPHSISLYAFEMDLQAARHRFGIDYTIFRAHDLYGPGQRGGVVGTLMAQQWRGEEMGLPGLGVERRAFSYVEDVAGPVVEAPLVARARNQVFNVGADDLHSTNEVARKIASTLEAAALEPPRPAPRNPPHPHPHPPQPPLPPRCDHGKIHQIFTLPASTSLEEGLQKMAMWMRRHPAAAPAPAVTLARVEIERDAPPVDAGVADVEAARSVAAGRTGKPGVEVAGGIAVGVGNNLPRGCTTAKATHPRALSHPRGWHSNEGEPGIRVPPTAVQSYRAEVNTRIKAFAAQPLKWRQLGDNKKVRPRTLLSIHTAVSYWGITEKMLVALAANTDDFDVVVVDDHSNRVNIERKAEALGVKVLKHKASKPKGNTYTWNLAWKYFLENPCYAYLIVCNNDLLVPTGTVTKLAAALAAGWAFVLPVTSHRGTTYKHHRLVDYYAVKAPADCLKKKKGKGQTCSADWTDQPMNFQRVQGALDTAMPRAAGQIVNSGVGNLNGYMMALNKELMRPHQMTREHLFDPSLKNTHNEDQLCVKMNAAGEQRRGVHTGAFVFHYKGYTLYSAHNSFGGGGRDQVGEKHYTHESESGS